LPVGAGEPFFNQQWGRPGFEKSCIIGPCDAGAVAGALALAQQRIRDWQAVRAELCRRFPAEFEHGYRTGYLGEIQPPCDAAGYMIGHHTWLLVRKNAWFSGFNLGHIEREAGDG